MTEETWREFLDKVELDAETMWSGQSPQAVVERCAEYMQQQYPGPYVLTYSYEKYRLEIHPYFQDPNEELMWHLKWG